MKHNVRKTESCSEDVLKRSEIVNSEASPGFLCRTVDAGVCELLVERRVDVRLERTRGERLQQNHKTVRDK